MFNHLFMFIGFRETTGKYYFAEPWDPWGVYPLEVRSIHVYTSKFQATIHRQTLETVNEFSTLAIAVQPKLS